MANDDQADTISDAEAHRRILRALEQAAPESRYRILHSVQILLGLTDPVAKVVSSSPNVERHQLSLVPSFSEDRSLSPKAFMMEKRPQTDVDRVACLAYYLTHYRAVENFKTLDISKLNTEAAQIKLSNPAQAVDNAAKAGLIIQSQKGAKRISAIGELYVQALPDRVAAREAALQAKPRRRKQRD